MSEFHHDPDSLADQLDQLLPPEQPDQIGTDDDPLTEVAARFASAPHPTLSPDAMARIQTQWMQTPPAPQRPVRLPALMRLATVAALLALVVAGTLYAARELGITLLTPDESTLVSTPLNTAPAVPTATSEVTAAPVASEIVPTVGQSLPPTAIVVPTAESPTSAPVTATFTAVPTLPTPTENLPPTVSPPPPATAAPTALPAAIIIEGPVQTIDENVITIYSVNVTLDASDPILAVLRIGDVVRVEGDSIAGADTLMVMATSAAIVNLEGFINLDGTIWRDPGDCSNPPPPSAPALDWRARCETTGNTGSPPDNGAAPAPGDAPTAPPGSDAAPPSEGGEAPPPANPSTVVICHHAPGASGQQETITVGWDAWVNAHSQHGDTLGPCQ